MDKEKEERGIIWRTKNVNCSYIQFHRFIKDEIKPSFYDTTQDHLYHNSLFNYINGKLDNNLCSKTKPIPTKFLQNDLMQDFMYVTIKSGLAIKITNFDNTVIYIGPRTNQMNSDPIRYDGVEKIKTIEIIDEKDLEGVVVTRFDSIYKKFIEENFPYGRGI